MPPKKEIKHSISMEVFGSRVEIIGGTVSPKEESWTFICPGCGLSLKAKLYFDSGSCEWTLSLQEKRK